MTRFFLNRITLIFGFILVVGMAAGLAYQVFYAAPAKACEASGNWWAEKWPRATPIDIKAMPKLETAAPAARPVKS